MGRKKTRRNTRRRRINRKTTRRNTRKNKSRRRINRTARRKYSRKAPRRRTKRSRDTVEAYSSLSGGADEDKPGEEDGADADADAGDEVGTDGTNVPKDSTTIDTNREGEELGAASEEQTSPTPTPAPAPTPAPTPTPAPAAAEPEAQGGMEDEMNTALKKAREDVEKDTMSLAKSLKIAADLAASAAALSLIHI